MTIKDGSAVLTGMLLAFVIPPGVSPLLPILAAVFAIYIGKHLLGGIGYNFFNPALLGRAFLLASFPVAMTSAWLPPVEGFAIFSFFGNAVDAVSTATPLAVLKEQGMAAFTEAFGSGTNLYGSFFLGWRPGCIGETSGFLLLLGGLYLLYRGYITWHIPVSLLATIGRSDLDFRRCRVFRRRPFARHPVGRCHARRFLYGDRLCYQPEQQIGKDCFRHQCRGADRPDQAKRRLSRRDLLRHPADEPSQYRS